jgi:hypothetical protein
VDSPRHRAGDVTSVPGRVPLDEGDPPLTFAWHDGVTVPPGMVRKVLVQKVGLSVEEALQCVRKVR